MNAAKNTISGEGIWELLCRAEKVIVAQNKKIVEFTPSADNRDEILAMVAGRTGNLRAPTLRVGNTYFVGFNDELYGQVASLR